MSTIGNEIQTLYHLARPILKRSLPIKERLEYFYSGQAEGYDDFRKRLLHGREPLFSALPFKRNCIWIDLGAGTGSNLEYVTENLGALKSIYLIDLCPSLLRMANERIQRMGLKNTQCIEADATEWVPPEGKADVVTLSYSLTMIPDWKAAIDHAHSLLEPGGVIGVTDFYVSEKHSWIARKALPAWFQIDHVYLSDEHLPYLHERFTTVKVLEDSGPIPFVPGLRAPFYSFVGRKS